MALEKEMQLKVEKTRISRELHDNIGAQLIHISMRLNSMSKKITEESQVEVDVLKDRLHETIQQLRDTIWVINKDEITFRELEQKITTLLWHFRQSESGTNYSLYLSPDLANIMLPPNLAINLHRIVQEALTNAFRHSQAKNIAVTIDHEENNIRVSIQDDGVGFKNEQEVIADHYGLDNMKKRAEDCDALFSILSKDKKGTTIQVLIPKENLQFSTANP
jgi:signal transduction histidine kinase